MLLNYNGRYEDVSTLAHELGHTMHSYLTNRTQPYPNSEYSIFVAEVASTLGEALLMDYMLKTFRDDTVRLLRKAGVDMTTSLPFELTVKKMNCVMDEVEGILAKMALTGGARRGTEDT
jgi:oligoendopeptidase F